MHTRRTRETFKRDSWIPPFNLEIILADLGVFLVKKDEEEGHKKSLLLRTHGRRFLPSATMFHRSATLAFVLAALPALDVRFCFFSVCVSTYSMKTPM